MPDFNELVKNLYTSKDRELTEDKLSYIEKTYKGKEEDFVKNFYATIGEELPEEKFNYIRDTYLKKKDFQGFSQELPKPTMPSGEKFTQGIGLGVKPISSTVSPSVSKPPKSTTPFASTGVKEPKKEIIEPKDSLGSYNPVARVKLYNQAIGNIQNRIPQLVQQFNEAQLAGDENAMQELKGLIDADTKKLDYFNKAIQGQKQLAAQQQPSTLGNAMANGLEMAAGTIMSGVNFVDEFIASLSPFQLSEKALKEIKELDEKALIKRPSDIIAKGGKEILKEAKKSSEETMMNMPYGGGVYDALKKGDLKSATSNAAYAFTTSLPTSLLMVNPITGSLAASGMAQESVDEKREEKGFATTDDYIVGSLKASTEYIFENMFGTGKQLKQLVSSLGKEVASETIEKTVKAGLKEYAKKLGLNIAEESFGEGLTQITQNAIDKADGKDIGLFDNVPDAALIGLFGGITQGGVTTTISHYVDRVKLKEAEAAKAKATELAEQALNAPSQVVADAIEREAEKLNDLADEIIEKNNEIGANAPVEITSQIEENNNKIDELEASISEATPEISEIITSQLKELELKNAELIKNAEKLALEKLGKTDESGISQEATPKGDTGVEVTEPVIEEGKEQVEIEETPIKEEITPEQIETGRQEVSAVKEGKIETANPIRLFKGLFGKRNLDGTHKSAHPNAKGVFSAVDEKVAERYKGEDGMGTFDIPAGTTMEVIRLAVRNVPMSKFREQETEAINASDAQIVKLITTDAKGAEEQYVIKDPALIEKMQKPEDVTKENVGYRQGDLVKKAENLWKMSSTDRSTGHFGTGYYFFGKKEDAEGYEENKRGVNKINLDNYNLAKGTKELHNLLKRVNEISSKTQETDIKNAVKGVMEYLGLFPEKPKMSENPTDAEFDALREYDKKNDQLVAPIAAAIQKQIPNKDNVNTLGENADSLSTVLMKSLGYEGIDSRGTELDNSRYGSVIYDIKPEDVKQTKEQEDAVQKQTTGQVPVQPETEVSEGVEGGKPKAEPKEVTEEKQEEVAKKAGISPKNLRDLYNVNRKLFGLDRVKSLASAVAMDRMIGAMAKRAGTTKAEMYGRLKFEKTSEKELPQGVKMQVDAWHGSPYQFDKFSTEFMGKGEGAQLFGWGLYFTNLESIARSYAENLTPVLYSYDGNLLSKDAVEYLNLADRDSELADFNQETIKAIAKKAIDKIKKEYIPDFKDIQKTSPSEKQRQVEMPEQIKIAKNVIKELQGIIASKEIKQEKNKKLYKVSLQKGKTPDQYTWLEWDKPVPRSIVKNFIEDLNKDSDFKKNYGNSYLVELENGEYDNLTGKYFYNGLAKSALQKLGKYSNKDVSLALLNVGIDGIKYPAESISRGATSETARAFNYVVFDENAVSIEEVIKFQKDANKARGAVMVTLDGEAVIYALTDPNVSTPLHELAHVFEHYLTEGEKQTIIKNAGTKGWTIETSEYFARGFEKYLAEGKSPVPALDKLFAKFKEWLAEIYNGIKGSDIDIKLNKKMRDIYSQMLGVEISEGKSKKEQVDEVKVEKSKKAFEALLKEESASPTAKKKASELKKEAGDKAVKEAAEIMENIDSIRQQLLDAGVIKSINCKWG